MELPAPIDHGFVGRRQIRRPPEHPGDITRDGIENLAAGSAGCHALVVGGKLGNILIPTFRQLSGLQPLPFLGQGRVCGGVGIKPGLPFTFLFAAATVLPSHVFARRLGDVKRFVNRPTVTFLGRTNLVFTQRFTMGAVGVLFVGRAVGDMTINDHEGWFLGLALGFLDGPVERPQIIGVGHVDHQPTVGLESRSHVLGKRQGGVAFDRDLVVVVNPDQLVKTQMTGQ